MSNDYTVEDYQKAFRMQGWTDDPSPWEVRERIEKLQMRLRQTEEKLAQARKQRWRGRYKCELYCRLRERWADLLVTAIGVPMIAAAIVLPVITDTGNVHSNIAGRTMGVLMAGTLMFLLREMWRES